MATLGAFLIVMALIGTTIAIVDRRTRGWNRTRFQFILNIISFWIVGVILIAIQLLATI